MNQTKKRLSIINLAISITDIETIQLQMLKLSLLKTDERLQEILRTLQNENYAQAQALITTYIETPNKEILQRTFQEEKAKKQKRDHTDDKAVIDEFNLFSANKNRNSDTEIQTLDLDDMLRLTEETELASIKKEVTTLDLDDMLELEKISQEEIPRKVHQAVNFDTLLNVKSDDILPDNIKVSESSTNDFWGKEISFDDESEESPKDTFFDEETSEDLSVEEEEISLQNDPIAQSPIEENPEKEDPVDPVDTDENTESNENDEGNESDEEEREVVNYATLTYEAIPYIDQKFTNMQVQYPLIEESDERYESVDKWLLKISNEGYSEADVEETIKKIDELRSEEQDEAAQLLLISAATESKYAQFILARTLYRGDILQKNSAEAFTLINRLAINDDYPEAVCDLAQFYEHGIGIEKDKIKAELLYEEAMQAGIKRAAVHFERIQKQNKGLFSFLKK